MITIPYTTKDHRDAIVSNQEAAGLILIEDVIRITGEQYMIFGTPEEHAAVFPQAPTDRVKELESQVSDLKARLEAAEEKLATVESKADEAYLKAEAVEISTKPVLVEEPMK